VERIQLVSHHLCPYVQRAVIALRERDIPFDVVYIDLANKPSWFTEVSPLGRVPLLRVGSAVLFESAAIVEYLEDTLPRPLHPRDPVRRAQHRAWMEFGANVLADIWNFYTAGDAAAMQQPLAVLRTRFERVEQALGAGPWFEGEAFSLVDAVFGPVFRYWEVFDLVPEAAAVFDGLPRVAAWRRALAARPSVQQAVTSDYRERLLRFVVEKKGELGRILAA
jgi:glutathione S-transferase